MRFYKQVSVPEHLFLSELVEWVALGRIPEVSPTNDGTADSRFAPEDMPDNFNVPPWVAVGYSEAECLAHNIEQTAEYREAYLRGTGWDELDNLLAMQEVVDDCDEWAEDLHERIQGARLTRSMIDEFETPFKNILGRAWARVFNAVSEGTQRVEGMLLKEWEPLLENMERADFEFDGQYIAEQSPFHELNPSLFQLDQDWRLNIIPGKAFNLRVHKSSLMKFNPIFTPLPADGERYAGIVVVAQEISRSAPPARGKGRPTAVDWSTYKIWLLSQHVKGDLPPKKEGAIAEVRVRIERDSGRAPPAISTVRSQLSSELSIIYDGN
ncbi:hypothetical protein [uncultured Ruegeria sp.]|uniref:hypothetical protein n=1 Tax=uncultured Ruegeria sp. TaxID=259304 RepID=UPI00261B32A4|nr:hypothetical protein [uncultured Ruegeria sp.]